MLVLTRRVGERLIIGDDIEVTILDARGANTKIGIKAPKTVRVDRAEIRESPDFNPNRKNKSFQS